MSIHGIGTDIVEVEKFRHHTDIAYEGGVWKYRRCFTDIEYDYCVSKADPAKHFAGMFAAKEACIKAARKSLSDGMRSIEVMHREDGSPYLRIGYPLEDELMFVTPHVTISHCENYATATVILEFGI